MIRKVYTIVCLIGAALFLQSCYSSYTFNISDLPDSLEIKDNSTLKLMLKDESEFESLNPVIYSEENKLIIIKDSTVTEISTNNINRMSTESFSYPLTFGLIAGVAVLAFFATAFTMTALFSN